MTTINVQFSDDTQATVIAYLACPQPDWENMGSIDTSDARWATYYNAQNPRIQRGIPAPDGAGTGTA